MELQASAGIEREHTARARFVRICVSRLLPLFLLLAAPAFADVSDNPRTVTLILSGEAAVYQRVSDAAARQILDGCGKRPDGCGNLEFKQLSLNQIDREDIQKSFLTITLGTRATNRIAQQAFSGNRIYAMLPEQAGGAAAGEVNRPVANIYIDQPYARYFDLIKTTVPRAARIGLLVYEGHLAQTDAIASVAELRGYTLKTGIVSGERSVGEALSYILDDIDVLLALPDSRIHNNHTISNILTTAYRNNIPVVGFSSAYVKAGAIAAIYTSPENIAQQVADAAVEFLAHGSVREPVQLASYFSVSYNFEVARSLGLPPIPPSEIKKAIMQVVEQ